MRVVEKTEVASGGKEQHSTEVLSQYYLRGRFEGNVIKVPPRFETGDSGVQIFSFSTIQVQ